MLRLLHIWHLRCLCCCNSWCLKCHLPSPARAANTFCQAKSGAAAQLVAAQAAALAGAKRARGDAEVDTSERGVEVAPGIIKRRVLNPHGPVVDGTAPAENLSQVWQQWDAGTTGTRNLGTTAVGAAVAACCVLLLGLFTTAAPQPCTACAGPARP